MPDISNFDFNFRPSSYWGSQTLSKRFGSTIKGELRPRSALNKLDEGTADANILKETLTESERATASLLHPSIMGGEYLPDLQPNEVEIARVVMNSTMMDIISIRARRTNNRIRYRIVSGYEEEGSRGYVVRPSTTAKPLTFRQLLSMMDGAIENGLVGNGRQMNFEGGGIQAEGVYDFDTASSSFYPQLAAWYDDINNEWLTANQKQIEKDEAVLAREGDKLPLSKTPLQLCIDGAKWDIQSWRGAQGMVHGFNMGLRRAAAEYYAKNYLERHKRLPEGSHQVMVSYGPAGTADIEPPFAPNNHGTLEVEITFPALSDDPIAKGDSGAT